MEGSRPLLVEVQSLVSPTEATVLRRVANGFDSNRMHMLLAVVERRGGATLAKKDGAGEDAQAPRVRRRTAKAGEVGVPSREQCSDRSRLAAAPS